MGTFHFIMSYVVYTCVKYFFSSLYSSFLTFKTLKCGLEKEYIRWMLYWTVYGFYSVVESLVDLLLEDVPFYYLLKLFLLVIFLNPHSSGHTLLYKRFIAPLLKNRESEIETNTKIAVKKLRTFAHSSLTLAISTLALNYDDTEDEDDAVSHDDNVTTQRRWSIDSISVCSRENSPVLSYEDTDIYKRNTNRLRYYQSQQSYFDRTSYDRRCDEYSSTDYRSGGVYQGHGAESRSLHYDSRRETEYNRSYQTLPSYSYRTKRKSEFYKPEQYYRNNYKSGDDDYYEYLYRKYSKY